MGGWVQDEDDSGSKKKGASTSSSGNIFDLDDLIGSGNKPKSAPQQPQPQPNLAAGADFDFFGAGPVAKAPADGFTLVLPAAKGNGLQVSTKYSRKNGAAVLELKFENQSASPLSTFALRINPANYLGVSMAAPLQMQGGVAPGGMATTSVALKADGACTASSAYGIIQGAVKTELGVVYFTDTLPTHLLFEDEGKLDGPTFVQSWKAMSDELEQRAAIGSFALDSVDAIVAALEPHRVFYTAKRNVDGVGLRVYFAARLRATPVLIELTLGASNRAACKSSVPELAAAGLQAVVNLVAKQ